MKNQLSEPDEVKLNALLRESRPAPPLPPRFQEAVWRRIEREEAEASSGFWPAWLDQFVERLLRPRFALAGVTALLAAGVLVGAAVGIVAAKQAAQERYLAAVAPNQIR